jgi:outer membrane protein OmpA-like peptidoglycan-associated protein
MGTSRSLIALATLAVVAAVPPTVRGAAGQPVDVDASVVPINVDAAVVPIDASDSVQPLEVQQNQGTLTTVTLSSDVLFAFNSSTLTATAQRTIDNLAARIRNTGAKRISVDGYTDSIGSAAYNLGLSRRRAAAVQRALGGALGGSGAPRIVTRGHGEADPVAPNTKDGHDNPVGRAQNRRVVISFPRG